MVELEIGIMINLQFWRQSNPNKMASECIFEYNYKTFFSFSGQTGKCLPGPRGQIISTVFSSLCISSYGVLSVTLSYLEMSSMWILAKCRHLKEQFPLVSTLLPWKNLLRVHVSITACRTPLDHERLFIIHYLFLHYQCNDACHLSALGQALSNQTDAQDRTLTTCWMTNECNKVSI